MAVRVNPKLINEIAKYGAEDVQKCYHCGNCSAICSHSDESYVFPRRPMRQLQMGLESRLRSSLDPWLCYYCGQCSRHCPRGAEPGETMMSLRRWLISKYDFTGLSRLFYRSWKAEIAAVVLVGLATLGGLLAYGLSHGDIHVYDGPGAFLPSSSVHVFDWAMASVLGSLLLINAGRMWWFSTGSDKQIKPTLWMYIKNLYALPFHFFTQKKYAECEERGPWAVHMVLVLSYVSMLVLIMFFLHSMQSGPEIRWSVHALGYAASIGLVAAMIYAIRGRLKRVGAQFQHSHESDWIFLVMILIVALTGIVQHVLHRSGAETAANVAYLVHLSLVVPMLVLEVPFSKWSHLVYRPLALYLRQVRRDAQAREQTVAQGAAAKGAGAVEATA